MAFWTCGIVDLRIGFSFVNFGMKLDEIVFLVYGSHLPNICIRTEKERHKINLISKLEIDIMNGFWFECCEKNSDLITTLVIIVHY